LRSNADKTDGQWKSTLAPNLTAGTFPDFTCSEDPAFIPESALSQLSESDAKAYRDKLAGNKVGGTPDFLQSDELPFPERWHLLLQLDSTQVPFWINFGDAGIGYAFLNGNGTEGKFLWQCC
jgi:uncharacterized protein YwqG